MLQGDLTLTGTAKPSCKTPGCTHPNGEYLKSAKQTQAPWGGRETNDICIINIRPGVYTGWLLYIITKNTEANVKQPHLLIESNKHANSRYRNLFEPTFLL